MPDTAHTGTCSVLIADDHQVFRESLREVITEELPGVSVLESKDGEEAVAIACARNPDIVVLDVSMPRTGGLEAAGRIRAARPKLHVIILTQHDNDMYRAEALKAGVEAYVLKNDVYSTLLPELDRLLAGTGHGHRAFAAS